MDGGKFKRKLSEVNTRAVSRGQNELVGKFKMTVGDVICVSVLSFPRGLCIEDVRTQMHLVCWS